MKRTKYIPVLIILTFLFSVTRGTDPVDNHFTTSLKKAGGEYTLVVEGFDWDAGVSKVILNMGKVVRGTNRDDFKVLAVRSSECADLEWNGASGERLVTHAYVRNEKCSGNVWVDYRLVVIEQTTGRVWDTESGRNSPPLERFDLSGRFRVDENLTMSYAWYDPGTMGGKSPLIIWLYGGGEGGADPSVPLMANRAANYASDEIQTIFHGAYVLVPQCPGAWMHNGQGVMTHGEEDDVYHVGLMALIRDFVSNHPNIDQRRIYVGGFSNGGYMSLKLILEHPEYFAAGYISALAYLSRYITYDQIERIKKVPIWFVHAADDQTTLPDQTVLPVYQRLKDAGAKNGHLSHYDHVVDITGFYGGKGFHYPGHWSWVYCHANLCRLDFDGSPVKPDGRPVTIMEWLAAQSK